MDYAQPAAAAVVDSVLGAISARGIHAEAVGTHTEALNRLKALIPAGASISTGASLTLKQIGFEDLLKDDHHAWRNLKAEYLAEPDPAKQLLLRRQSSLADYFIGSVHAVTHAGQLVIASASGSQLGPYAYTAKNVIWVVGSQKIVPTLDDAFHRIHDHIIPHEELRMRELTGGKMGTSLNKVLIFEREAAFLGRTVTLVLVREPVGD
jgi:L-lactate utilization protein LutC